MSVSPGDVTVDDWRDVIALGLDERQREWMAPNPVSLPWVRYGPGGEVAHLILVPLAIYADETP